MKTMELALRRKALLDRMEDGSIALIFSGYPKIKSEDENFNFEVNHSFYYLTGIEQEECVLMLVSNQGERKEYLFIPPFDETKAKWYGKRLSIEEASSLSGIRNVLIDSSLERRIESELSGSYSDFGTVDKVYLDLSPELKIQEEMSTRSYSKTLSSKFPGVSILNVHPLISELRLIKSDDEIAKFSKAIETTNLGIRALMAELHPSVKEYELADVFEHVINDDNGYNGLSFNSIIASGDHACTLHYPRPLGECKDGDLLLIDLGARHEYYCADISRTFPVNGKFTPLQRTIYEIVLGANKMVASIARPGLTIKELQNMVISFMANECVSKGLIEKPEDLSKVYFHNVSHFIGLDTHDVGDRNKPLQARNIISNEPGLYFADLGIGVRIEDDLLITKDGCENLSEGIMKDPDAIETFLSSRYR